MRLFPSIVALLALMVSINISADECDSSVNWCRSFSASLSDKEGNSQHRDIDIEGRIKREERCCGEFLNKFQIKGRYELEDEKDKDQFRVNKLKLNIDYEQQFTRLYGWTVGQEFKHDEGKNLQLRQETRGALTYTPIRFDKFSFKLIGGIAQAGEYYSAGKKDQHELYWIAGNDICFSPAEWVTISHSLEFSPEIEQTKDFWLESSLDICFPLKANNWKLHVVNDYTYMNIPPKGKKNYDRCTKLKLCFSF